MDEQSQIESVPVKTRSKKWIIWLIVAAIALIAAVIFFSGGGFPLSRAVAHVNGETITRDELDRRIAQVHGPTEVENTHAEGDTRDDEVLDGLISERLLLQTAKENGFTAAPEEVDVEYARIKNGFPDEAAFMETLSSNKITEAGLRKDISEQLVIQNFVTSSLEDRDISVSDEEIQSAYDTLSAQDDTIPTLGEVREQIASILQNQKISQFVISIVDGLKEKADIRIVL